MKAFIILTVSVLLIAIVALIVSHLVRSLSKIYKDADDNIPGY